MTKCIVLGETQQEEKKPIEFVKYFYAYEMAFKGLLQHVPKDYNYVELVCRKYSGGDYDIMLAYDNLRDSGCLYLGHWNGGVV